MYGVEVSPALVSKVTDGILEELTEWQNRPLDGCYPLLYIDAMVVKVRTSGTVINRPAYVVMLLFLSNRCFYVLQIAFRGWGLFELFGGVVWGWGEFWGFGGGFSSSR